MAVNTTFARQFAELGQESNRQAFEIRFNQIQRGLLQQMNEELLAIDGSGAQRRAEDLQKDRDAAFEKSEKFQTVREDLLTNELRFADIAARAQTASDAANIDGDDTLSATELSALTAAVAELREEVARLFTFDSASGVTDGNLKNIINGDLQKLLALSPVEGTIDATGTTPATNDNRALINGLNDLAAKALNFSESASVLKGAVNQLVLEQNRTALEFEGRLTDLTAGELQRQDELAVNIQNRYENLIRSISLLFETGSGLGDALAAGNQFEPDPGSILNILT